MDALLKPELGLESAVDFVCAKGEEALCLQKEKSQFYCSFITNLLLLRAALTP